MLLFMDGFDHMVTADLTKKWNSVGATATVSATAGRGGGGALQLNTNSSTSSVTKTIPAGAAFVLGFRFSTPAFVSMQLASFLDAGTNQCELRLNADGTLSVSRNGTALTSGTTAFALSLNTSYYIEWKVTIADSIATDSCVVRINNAIVLTVPAAQDTKNTANASANAFRLGTATLTGGVVGTAMMDDFYLCDQSGATLNNFLGDSRIDTLYPNADGFYSQFTPSTGTSHFALVDEATPNTTDYNDGLNVGDRDSYAMTNLPALTSQVIHALQVNAAILKDDAGAKSAATMVRSSSTNADGTSVPLGTTQSYVSQIYAVNPNGSVAWTEASVNALEAGVVVTA